MQARHMQPQRGLAKAQGPGEQSHRIGADPQGHGQGGNSPLGPAESGGSRSASGSSYGDFKPDRGAFGDRQQGGHMGDYYAGGADARGAGGQPPGEDFASDYHRWRADQLRQLDEDYRAWRQERYQQFSQEFGQWRAQQQQQQQQQRPDGPASRPQAEGHDEAEQTDPQAMATSGQQASLGYGGTGRERETDGSTSGGAADGSSGASPTPARR